MGVGPAEEEANRVAEVVEVDRGTRAEDGCSLGDKMTCSI